MGRKPMTAEQRAKMRGKILDAARQQFLETGLESLSMRGIATRVGVSSMTLYLYYESRQDIVRHLVLEGFNLLDAELQSAILLGSARDKIAKLADAYIRFATTNPRYYTAMFRHVAAPEEKSVDVELESAVQATSQRLQRTLENAEYATRDAAHHSSAIWAHLHGWSTLIIGGQVDPAQFNANKVSASFLQS